MTDTGGNPSNLDRPTWGTWGAMAVETFKRTTGLGDADGIGTVVGDLLADLMHYCRQNDVDFSACLDVGRWHFDCEVRGVPW